ncbi:MAG: type II secretion system protein [Candidatus Omnitrophota bacterium]
MLPGTNRGISLIAVIIIMLIVATLALLVASIMSTGSRSAIIDMQAQQVFYIAEAGIRHYIYLIKDGTYSTTSHPSLTKSFSIGTYTVTSLYNADISVYTITSIATAGTAKRVIIESVALTSAILDRGIHADGSNVDFTSSSGTINGNISCHVDVSNYSGMTINGDLTEGLAKVNPVLNYSYYQSLAQAAGQYYTSDISFSNGTYTGVWYTTRKATIGDNAVINGSIITEGDITFNGKANNVQINPSNNYPALATQSNIMSTDVGSPEQRIGLQNSTINGLIISGTGITFDNIKNSTFNGTILAGGNLQMQYGTGIIFNYNEEIFAPMPPGFTYSTGGTISIIPQNDWKESL